MTGLFPKVLPIDNARAFVEQMFRNFDSDSNGLLDFKEFIMAMDATLGSNVEEKLMWSFRIIDRDKSGNHTKFCAQY